MKNRINNYEREFSEISDTIITAYQNWEIWWLYQSERPKYVNVMNNYLSFFTNSIHAHWVAMIMAIWCLIDTKNISLISLFKTMSADNYISKETIKTVNNRIDSISHIIKGITIIRHNIVAHISNKINSDEVFIKAGLKHDDIENIILELGSIFNLIRVATGKNVLGFNFKVRLDKPGILIENDVKRLLQDLKIS